jgi:hypothetical protein
MTIYTVHAPPDAEVSAETAQRIRFVKEGFSFWALVLPAFWLLFNRLWLGFLGWLAVIVALQVAGRWVGEMETGVVAFVFGVWFAIEARDIQRWTLARRGWRFLGVVEGPDRDTAERRFFEAWLGAGASAPTAPADPIPPKPAAPPAPAASSRPAPSGVIGLFPSTGGR